MLLRLLRTKGQAGACPDPDVGHPCTVRAVIQLDAYRVVRVVRQCGCNQWPGVADDHAERPTTPRNGAIGSRMPCVYSAVVRASFEGEVVQVWFGEVVRQRPDAEREGVPAPARSYAAP